MSRKPASRGARQSETRFGHLWQAWTEHHKSSALDSFGRLADTPIQTFFTALVVAIALALPAALLVVLGNVQQLADRWDSTPKLTVFLKKEARDTAIQGFQTQLRTMPEIASIEYLSPEQALRDFESQSRFSEALRALDSNPLPPTIIITPAAIAVDEVKLESLRQRLLKDGLVDDVNLDIEWVKRLNAMMDLGRDVIWGFAALLSLGVLLVIGNTIRLEIENRRDEILVIKLVGGTDGFVRRPFLYTGFWYGVIGGLLACLLVSTSVALLTEPVNRVALAYHDTFSLQGLGVTGCVMVMGCCVFLGSLGAWLAVGRHLSAIEPH